MTIEGRHPESGHGAPTSVLQRVSNRLELLKKNVRDFKNIIGIAPPEFGPFGRETNREGVEDENQASIVDSHIGPESPDQNADGATEGLAVPESQEDRRPSSSQDGCGRDMPAPFDHPRQISPVYAHPVMDSALVFPFADEKISSAHRDKFVAVEDFLRQTFETDPALKRRPRPKIHLVMRMCGANEEDAEPTIIVLLDDREPAAKVVERVSHILRKPHVKKQYLPFFRILCIARFQPLGNTNEVVDVLFQPGHSLCGYPVKHPVTKERLCTIACILNIGAEVYGLTTSHPFDSVADIGHAGAETTGEYEGIEDFPTGDRYPRRNQAHASIKTRVLESCVVRRTVPEVTEGEPGPLLDWALVKLQEPDTWLPNSFRLGERELQIAPLSSTPEVNELYRKVFMIVFPHPPFVGYIRSRKTSILGWDNSEYPLEVWTVATVDQNSSFTKGFSGALVVDAKTIQPYGHIIAINPLGDLYVIPLESTIEQIKRVLAEPNVAILSETDNKVEDISMVENLTRNRKTARPNIWDPLVAMGGANFDTPANLESTIYATIQHPEPRTGHALGGCLERWLSQHNREDPWNPVAAMNQPQQSSNKKP